MSNPIIKRIFFHIEYELLSPLAISGGDSINTDSDVILDASGMPFIPGTSIAGAVRNYLAWKNIDDADALFGWTKDEKGHMSPLWIFDSFFIHPENATISTRDGVKINDEVNFDAVTDEEQKSLNWFLKNKEKKAADKGKFDMEIVETGTKGTSVLQLVIRKRNNVQDKERIYDVDEAEKRWTNALKNIAGAVNAGDIRFGAKKNRGMGKIKLEKIRYCTFDKNNVEEWIQFKPFDSKSYDNLQDILPQIKPDTGWESPFLTFSVKLDLPGGISIRQYSAQKGKADFEQIICNGVPVIPGSSWSGAIRNQSASMLRLLGVSPLDVELTLNEWFGPVFKDAKEYEKKAEIIQSNVMISESALEGTHMVTMTRNQINRFTSGTINGALYTEKTTFNEREIELEIKIRKNLSDYKALAGLLILVIKDIQNGYCAVGGQTSVGRGIFCGTGPIIDNEADFLKALVNYVKKSKGERTC